MLIASTALAEHALGHQQQRQQAGRQRGLHNYQRRQQQRQDLQRPAEDRKTGAQQPAPAPQQPAHERYAQVLLLRRLLRVDRLQRDP